MKVLSKKDLRKVSDWLWEIPKDFREEMRVPARIYASEKMLKETEDEALIQLVNTTTLPGIVKYAIAMPDIHSGYGPPIGEVGAMRYPDGVISPGFVGYDENCISSETKILLKNGAYLSAEELDNYHQVKVVDFNKKNLNQALIFNFFKKYNNPSIFRVRTISGEEILATEDHPLRTEKGMVKIKELKEGEKILVYPYKGVKFEKPSEETILSENDFLKSLKKLGRDNSQGNPVSQILKQLKSKELLPVKYNSPFLGYLLKIIGFILGDGVISLDKKNKNPQIQFYASPEDLKEIQKDLKKLGFTPSRIYSRKRKHTFINAHNKIYNFSQTEYRIKINSSSLAYLLISLGVPCGPKAYTSYRVPQWIFKCPLWQKRLFLGAFFGAELSKPKTMNKYNFYAPQLSVSKEISLKESGRLFLKDISKLLKEFGVETYPIVEVPGYRYQGKKGKTTAFRLQIKENAENLIRFFEKVGYEYNQERRKEACLAANYLRRKLRIVEMRRKAREEIQKLYKGKNCKKNKYVSIQFLLHSLFKETRWGDKKKRGKPRIAFNFLSFEEFKKKYSYGNSGLVFDEIEKIEKLPYSGFVYDFTVNHPDHNFIANSFVVSNCGVRLLTSEYSEKEIRPYLDKIATAIQREVPSGLGKERTKKLSIQQINKILEEGVPYLVEKGYGEKEDIENCEHQGKMEQADASCVSERAKNRGRGQLGTLGSGNHFCEIDKVEKIFDKEIAKTLGLFENQVVILIHTGSRGLGHQNCSDYLRIVISAYPKYKIRLPDKELACVPFCSPEGERFFKALSAVCNYAWANRQMITFYVRKAWKKIFGEKTNLKLLYDVAHNIAKIEEHEVNGKKMKLIVHRKGATRAFPPGHAEIPEKYKETGQPVLIPGSMGTPSYILVGTEKAKESWYTVCHGAGRRMSRRKAIKAISGYEVVRNLERRGIIVKCYSMRGVAEEAPQAYKNIDDVVEVVDKAGLSKKVAKLSPLAVIKGE